MFLLAEREIEGKLQLALLQKGLVTYSIIVEKCTYAYKCLMSVHRHFFLLLNNCEFACFCVICMMYVCSMVVGRQKSKEHQDFEICGPQPSTCGFKIENIPMKYVKLFFFFNLLKHQDFETYMPVVCSLGLIPRFEN